MNSREAEDFQRRKLALEKAVEAKHGADSDSDIVARAEAFNAFLRGDKPAKAD